MLLMLLVPSQAEAEADHLATRLALPTSNRLPAQPSATGRDRIRPQPGQPPSVDDFHPASIPRAATEVPDIDPTLGGRPDYRSRSALPLFAVDKAHDQGL